MSNYELYWKQLKRMLERHIGEEWKITPDVVLKMMEDLEVPEPKQPMIVPKGTQVVGGGITTPYDPNKIYCSNSGGGTL